MNGVGRVMVRTLLLGTLLVVLGGIAHADDDDEAQDARERSRAEERAFALRVNEAIGRGYEWLRANQLEDGTFPVFGSKSDPQNLGRQAMVLYTLARCGATLKDSVIKRGLRGLAAWQKKVSEPGWGLKTYSVAMLILMYDALHGPPLDSEKQRACRYPKLVRKEVQTLLDWIVEHQEKRVWRYPGGRDGNEDMSHTQLVLLALDVAGHCGLDVEPAVFEKALKYVLEEQDDDGPEEVLWLENPAWQEGVENRYGRYLAGPKFAARGWSYRPEDGATGSMTAAGIAALSIIKARLAAQEQLDESTRKTIDHCMLEGLAWLSKGFSVNENPGWGNSWHYYYLWSLERVGTLLGRRNIGKHDWYREGAGLLLLQQGADGGWPSPEEGATARHEDEILQTCFALLFLKRATVPPTAPLMPEVVTPR